MILFLFLVSRQGKVRLARWYRNDFTSKERSRIIKDVCTVAIGRSARLSNLLPFSLPAGSAAVLEALRRQVGGATTHLNDGDSSHKHLFTLVSKRYASLTFIACVENSAGMGSMSGSTTSPLAIPRPSIGSAFTDEQAANAASQGNAPRIAPASDNELLTLEIIHYFVEALDKYFKNVCELDLIYNFHKAYMVLDEIILAGELQETSKKTILKYVQQHDMLMEEEGASANGTVNNSSSSYYYYSGGAGILGAAGGAVLGKVGALFGGGGSSSSTR